MKRSVYLVILLICALFLAAGHAPAGKTGGTSKKGSPAKEKASTEIHEATKNGDLAKIKALLKKNLKLINLRDGIGATPLYYAVMKGNNEIVSYLLSKGADVNAKTEYNLTPLFMASKKDMAELLIKRGADVNARNQEDQTPLFYAAVR